MKFLFETLNLNIQKQVAEDDSKATETRKLKLIKFIVEQSCFFIWNYRKSEKSKKEACFNR